MTRYLAFVALLGIPFSALSQTPSLPGPGVVVVSGLSGASSLRVDPAGLIYIADPGRHVVDVRRRDGSLFYVLGGPGTGQEQFDGPVDVDPTNGLLVVVADAGNHRLARFRSRFQLGESIPLYGSSREKPGLAAPVTEREGLSVDDTPGRPLAVALTESNETFAIDEVRGVVAKWDMSRRFVAFVGDRSGYGELRRPVAIEIVDDQLFVADEDLRSVVVFDLFGGFVSELGSGQLVGIAGLGGSTDRLWVLHGDQLSVYSTTGVLEDRYSIPADETGPWVDVAVQGGDLYLLSRSRVKRWPLDATGRPAVPKPDP